MSGVFMYIISTSKLLFGQVRLGVRWTYAQGSGFGVQGSLGFRWFGARGSRVTFGASGFPRGSGV